MPADITGTEIAARRPADAHRGTSAAGRLLCVRLPPAADIKNLCVGRPPPFEEALSRESSGREKLGEGILYPFDTPAQGGDVHAEAKHAAT